MIVPMGPDKWGRNSPRRSLGLPQMPVDPPSFSDAAAADEVRKILSVADLPIKVRCVSEWAVEVVLGERYRVGRVFFAGGDDDLPARREFAGDSDGRGVRG